MESFLLVLSMLELNVLVRLWLEVKMMIVDWVIFLGLVVSMCCMFE